MRIQLRAAGELREHFGRSPVEIKLPDGASFRHLMGEIATRWGAQLPAQVWDAAKGTFRGAIYLVRDGHAVLDSATALKDGEEIVVLRALSGG